MGGIADSPTAAASIGAGFRFRVFLITSVGSTRVVSLTSTRDLP